MLQELQDLIKKVGVKHYSRSLSKNPKLLAWVEFSTYFLPKSSSIPERVWCIINNINEFNRIDICQCGNKKLFNTLEKGYRKYCAPRDKCPASGKNHSTFMSEHQKNLSKVEKKRRVDAAVITFMEKYEAPNPMQSSVFLANYQKTLLEETGYKSNIERPTIIKKFKQKNIKNIGVEYPFQSKDIRDKSFQTFADNNPNAHDHMEIARQSFLDQNDGKNPFQIEENIDKSKQTRLDKFGKEFYSQTDMWLEDVTKTSLEKYERENYMQIHIPTETIELFNIKEEVLKLYPKYSIFELSDLYKVSTKWLYNRIAMHGFIAGKSSYEKAIAVFLEENNITYIKNDHSILKDNRELDFYIPSHNLAIEMCGLYWHSDEFHKSHRYHRTKTEECNQKNIQLITIFEDEWLTKNNVVKRFLLNLLQKNNDNKIAARKCKIKEYSFKDVKTFLDENHLQSSGSPTSINLGLEFENKLVALMTFSNSSKRIGMGKSSSQNEFELVRFVSGERKVMGGAGKLFKYFLKIYKPNKVYSFADARWSVGNMYEKIGFTFKSITKPSYWYFRNEKERLHRYDFAKYKLVKKGHDALKTERDIMKDLGYKRIYDCGHYRYEWNNQPKVFK